MKKRSFSIRALLYLTLLVACFMAGYGLGVKNRQMDPFEELVSNIRSTIDPNQWLSSGTVSFPPSPSTSAIPLSETDTSEPETGPSPLGSDPFAD